MDAAFTGNMTTDPKVSELDSGKTKVAFRVAVNETYVDQSGKRIDRTPIFFTVEWWGLLAKEFASVARKGALVMVQGSWRGDTWEQDGEKKTRQFVAASSAAVVKLPPRAPETSGAPQSEDKWAAAK